jgi:hypothetical protein
VPDRHRSVVRHRLRSQRGGELRQGQPMPTEAGASFESSGTQEIVGRVEVRSNNQYLLGRRASLKPGAGTANATVTD